MKLSHCNTADQHTEYLELNDLELANVSGGQSVGLWQEDDRPHDRCYYDKKRHRRYCYDRHGRRYESR